jgi:hypothetical protein
MLTLFFVCIFIKLVELGGPVVCVLYEGSKPTLVLYSRSCIHFVSLGSTLLNGMLQIYSCL